MNYGFFRVAAAAPRLRVADPDYNAGQLETVIDRAVAQQVRLLVTPSCPSPATPAPICSLPLRSSRRRIGRCSGWLPIRRARVLRC